MLSNVSFSQVENEENITVKNTVVKSETGVTKKVSTSNTLEVKQIERPIQIATKKEKVAKAKEENN